jgi:hypothetical protein
VRLVGLLAAHKEHETGRGAVRFLTLLDEEGLFDVVVPPGCDAPDAPGIGPWLVEGQVQEQHGLPVLQARKLEKATPGLGKAGSDDGRAGVSTDGLSEGSEGTPSDEPDILPLNGSRKGGPGR